MLEYRCPWSIPNAGPSVSTFHFDGTAGSAAAGAAANAIRAFFLALAGSLPDDVTVTFDSEVREIDVATGELTNVVSIAPPPPVPGTVTGEWPAGTGARIVWQTPRILRGRRVRGATFIVPIGAGLFTTGGQLGIPMITACNSAGTTLISQLNTLALPLLVYSRRVLEQPAVPGLPPVVLHPGTATEVTTVATSPIVATLRGRKY